MFPPEKTTDPNTVLQNLWGSLQRAAPDHWDSRGYIEPSKETPEAHDVTLMLASPIPNNSWEPLHQYIRGYVKASGWVIRKLYRRKDALVLKIAPRSERAPNPRREPPETVG